MLRNYLNAALRNLTRNKFYAGLNILGLAVGFAAALLIALFVRDELSYDKWLPNSQNIYLLAEKLQIPNQAPLIDLIVPQELKKPLLLDYPGIERIVRLEASRMPIRRGDIEVGDELIYWADPEFFETIQLESLAGDLKTALAQPDTVVLTQRMAQKYFGKDNPIGETFEFDRRRTLKVTAILKDLPSNTQFNTDIIASALSTGPRASGIANKDNAPSVQGWTVGAYTYVTFKPGTSADDLRKDLSAFVAKRKAEAIQFVGKSPLLLFPLTDVHFLTGVRGGTFFTLNPNGDIGTLQTIGTVGVLILLIAGINFVNLTTARTSRRAVEVGVRKAAGGDPGDLVVQFIGEAMLYVAFGMIVAMIGVSIAMSGFNAYLDRTIAFDFWADPMLLGGIVGIILVVGFFAGAYPAFVLARLRPRTVLKSGTITSTGSSLLRSGLVVIQFAIMIGLILVTAVVYRQSDYLANRGVRLDTQGVHVVAGGCGDAMIAGIRALPGVERTACSGGPVLNRGKGITSITLEDGTDVTVDISPVDIGFFELYGVKHIAGRIFSTDYPGDRQPDPPQPTPGQPPQPQPPPTFNWPLVVNETLARKIAGGNPADAVGKIVRPQMGPTKGQSEIIGVVPDFGLDVASQTIPPTIHFLQAQRAVSAGGFLSVKLKPDADAKGTLDEIDKLWKQIGQPRPISRFSMAQYLKTLHAGVTRQAQIFAAFAVIAVFIATLGLFGLSAFTAERRTKEIGVRKALGADRAPIVRLLMWQFTKPVLWANLIAWPVSYYLITRWLTGFAYHIDIEPWLFAAASLVALLIAWVTISGYSYRVSGAKPAEALRYE